MRRFSVFTSLVLVIFLFSNQVCISHPPDRIPERNTGLEKKIEVQAKVLSLTVIIKEAEISLVKSSARVGTLTEDELNQFSSGELDVVLRDVYGSLLGRFSLENPLISSVELSVVENEGGASPKIATLDSAIVTVNLPYPSELDFVQFFLRDNKSETHSQKYLGAVKLSELKLNESASDVD